jgi:hypothetical protein
LKYSRWSSSGIAGSNGLITLSGCQNMEAAPVDVWIHAGAREDAASSVFPASWPMIARLCDRYRLSSPTLLTDAHILYRAQKLPECSHGLLAAYLPQPP